MKLKRRGVLGFLSACLPLWLARRSVAAVPAPMPDPVPVSGPGPDVEKWHNCFCNTPALLEMQDQEGLAAPVYERLPLPLLGARAEGKFFTRVVVV